MSGIIRKKEPGEAWESVPDTGNGGSQTVLSVTVPVSSAQVLALGDTPVELVPTPGPNKAVLCLALYSVLSDGDPYTISDPLYVLQGLNEGTLALQTRLVSGTAGVAIDGLKSGAGGGSADVAIRLGADGANPTGGTIDLTLTLLYVEVDV
jgi:hypothetical protein